MYRNYTILERKFALCFSNRPDLGTAQVMSRMGRLNSSYCVMAQLKVTLSSIATATGQYRFRLRVKSTLQNHLSRGSCHLLIVKTFLMSFLLLVAIFLVTIARATEVPSSMSPPIIENIPNADSVLNCMSLSHHKDNT